MEIHYRLQKMEEVGFSFKPDFDFQTNSLDVVNFQFTHQLKPMPESSEIAVTMVTEITPEKSNEVIASQSIYCVFWVDPFDKVIQTKDESFTTSEPLLIDTFINIAIGALRGMLVKNFKGTQLSGIVMPLIPMDIIRQNSMQTNK
jgi:hypothetical protein